MFDPRNLLTSGWLCLATGVAAAVAVTLQVTAWLCSIAAEEAETIAAEEAKTAHKVSPGLDREARSCLKLRMFAVMESDTERHHPEGAAAAHFSRPAQS